MKINNLKAIQMALFCMAMVCFSAFTASAQWSVNPAINTPVVTDINRQNANCIASDGSGGAIIAWWNYNLAANNYDIYAQRINSQGVIQWAAGGVPICTNPGFNHVPYITSDGEGGAIIAWSDTRNVKNEVFAQKINASGVVQWAENGVSVGTVATHYQHGSPEITTDGNGGAIIAWADWRKNEFNDEFKAIYAQRISSNGITMWGVGGRPLNDNTSESNDNPRIVSDGSGGAVVTWSQWIGKYPSGDRNVFAQKVNSAGGLDWGAGSLTICSAPNEQAHSRLAADGAGGAIIAWQDTRDGTKTYPYAQKVSSGGTIQWAENGIRVSSATTNYGRHRLVGDGNGGAIITWESTTTIVWGQLLNTSGLPQWTADGVAIVAGANPQIISDGANGAVITWEASGNIKAQRMNPSGALLWATSGAIVCNNTENQWGPVLTTDGSGGAIISWDDYRNEFVNSTDVYAQQISSSGAIGVVTGIDELNGSTDESLRLYQNYPNPASGPTRIEYKVIRPGNVSLTVNDIAGREILTLVNASLEPGDYSVEFDTYKVPAGLYFYTLSHGPAQVTRQMVVVK